MMKFKALIILILPFDDEIGDDCKCGENIKECCFICHFVLLSVYSVSSYFIVLKTKDQRR
jgi:hypothetical protein